MERIMDQHEMCPPQDTETVEEQGGAIEAAATPTLSDLRERELRHRMANLFATARSLLSASVARAEDVETLAADLDGRLAALEAAHTLAFGDAGGELDLGRLVETELAPYTDGARCGDVAGPPVMLSEQAGPVIALVVHELTTNAAKHGALSAPGGRVRVRWRFGSGMLFLSWRESGGAAASLPSAPGFGLRVSGTTVPRFLHGRADMRPTAGGLAARFLIGAEHVRVS